MYRPAIVATDLDGTLIRTDGGVSERTRRALRRAREAGATVVFVTGRPIRVMADVVAKTAVSGIAVCANGAIVYDLDTCTTLANRSLDATAALRLAIAIREVVPDVAFAVESGLRFGREQVFRTMWPDPDELIGEVAELLSQMPASKLLVRRGGESLADVYEEIVALAGADAVVTRSTENLVEIAGAGVSKAVALAEVAAAQGLTAADVVAFGDMHNDIPMLLWAGHAVAVANAHPDVKAAAHEVTASNDNDGVAQVLERLFP